MSEHHLNVNLITVEFGMLIKLHISQDTPQCRCVLVSHIDVDKMAEEFDRREKELIDGGDLNRENNELNRIGKQHSVDSLKKLKEISKSSIINMNTIKDIQNYVKENYDISIQGFENLSLDKNKIIFSGLDDMLRSYPDVKNSLAGVIFDEGIKHDGLLRGFDIHIGKSGLNYETIIHELSHVMDKERSSSLEFDYSEKVLKEARKILKLRSNSKRYLDMKFEIVGYNKKDYSKDYEVFAYSLETELTNSKLGNKLSKAILEVINVYKR